MATSGLLVTRQIAGVLFITLSMIPATLISIRAEYTYTHFLSLVSLQ